MAFTRRKNQQGQYVADVLNAQDIETVVVRGKQCKLLFTNTAARQRAGNASEADNCQELFAGRFNRLCEECPLAEGDVPQQPEAFEVHDKAGSAYSARCSRITWVDDKPATILFLQDESKAQETRDKLYNLAYVDQLTAVPNRQKFKEDFEEVSADIENGRLQGMVGIFDLDNFKRINDAYGHNTGDIMLRRLTEYLLEQPDFKENLYRLGGDEFVLFYKNKTEQFASEESFREHYAQLVQGAFQHYTMPNIEMDCTISMGVCFYPAHGTTASELLRKADIALYKAKGNGRNQLVLFEDQYDTAKKFKDLYINIQPILTHTQRTYGYELVDRGNEGKGSEDELNLGDMNRAIDALGLSEIENDSRYFISFSNHLLSASVLNNLPKDKFVVQLQADEITTKEQVEQISQLRRHGYALALAGLNGSNASGALLKLVEFAKFAPGEVDGFSQQKIIAANGGVKFIATGVNTGPEFDSAKRRGFKLFQGFFFNEPNVVQKTKEIDPMKVNYFRLLKLTSTDGYVDFSEISQVISTDVALSYKLLRLLNSAAVGLRNQVSSISMAVAYLGEDSLKKWIAMLALRGLASDKPLELVRMSLIRAQFGELMAPHFKPPRDEKHVFLVGLFSLLHIALEKTPEELLAEIPVADDIRSSLLTKTGPYSDLVAFYTDYEYGNWDEVTRFSDANRLGDRLINDSYIAAVNWYNDLAEDTD